MLLKDNEAKLVIDPSSVGRVPFNGVLVIDNSSKAVNNPSSVGSVPAILPPRSRMIPVVVL